MDKFFKMWSEDSEIDKTNIADESLKISRLHNKYLQHLTREKLKLRMLEEDFKHYYLLKYEFYRGTISDEDLEDQGWQQNQLKILKTDVSIYIDADQDVINKKLTIALQKERVDFLESVLRTLNNRGYLLKNYIDWMRFTSGY